MTPPTVPPLDDAAARAVWADLLVEQGAPRGALAQLQLAREDRPDDPRLARAEAALLAREARALLGPLRHATSLLTLTWRRGSVVEAVVQSQACQPFADWTQRQAVEVKRPPLARRVRELLSLEIAQELASLSVALRRSVFSRAVLHECAQVVEALRPASLRTLRLLVLEERFEDWDSLGWFPGETAEVQRGDLLVMASVELLSPLTPALSPFRGRG